MMDISTFLQPLVIDQQTLQRLALELSKTYRHLALTSTEQFLATPINVLPSGSETGRMLAIDVGGTNLRVGFIDLLGSSTLRRSYDRSWPIGNHFKMDKAQDLFNWIGDCIAQVIAACLADFEAQAPGSTPLGDVVPLGIAWSFPLIQSSISNALVMQMGKGFGISGNQNLGDLLLAGYSRHMQSDQPPKTPLPRIQIAAICNDTLATFASLAYTAGATRDKHVSMGLIVGTGTNAAIPMKMSDLHLSKQESMQLPADTGDDYDDTVVVNTEWSIKGTAAPLHDLALITRWDEIVDKECTGQPGFMPFEYMAGGRFFGELVRLIVLEYFIKIDKDDLSVLPVALRSKQALDTLLLSSAVAADISIDKLALALSQQLPPPANSPWSWTTQRIHVLQEAAHAVSARSANMVAAAVVAALACNGEFAMFDPALARQRRSSTARAQANNERIVAYTGGVISQFPHYLERCQAAIDLLVQHLSPPGIEQHIILSEVLNGSVIGAGVLAGTVWNIPHQQRTDLERQSKATQA